MRFKLKEKNGFIPDLNYGEPGQELGCFIPKGYSWEQINYGQGEGQVIINNCEWGIYYSEDDAITIILHDGVVTIDECAKLLDAIRAKIFSDKSNNVEIFIIGDN